MILCEQHCRARGCPVKVRQGTFMCPLHWNLLSAKLRRGIHHFYRMGAEPWNPADSGWKAIEEAAKDAVEKKLFERCIQNHSPACSCWKPKMIEEAKEVN
jgi:hypothetical protein